MGSGPVKALTNRLLGRFTDWFESGAGVWQTTGLVLVVVAVEFAYRTLDPHAFVLMAVLTVYSAITQPALAHSNAVSSEKLERILRHISAILDHHGIESK